MSTTDIYIAAFYWSSMTMTTIGYGDIVPSTLVERIFVSFAMLVGAFVYGYIIGAVSNVISTKNAKKNDFYKLMGELNSFLKEGRWDHDLCMRLREYFKYRLASSHVDAHTALLQQMSPALRAEITLGMNTWITKVDFFRKCPEALVIQLTMNMKQSTFPPQEKILVPGDWCDKMFMVRKGVAICRKKIVTTGQVFCVECLYKEGKVSYSAHAVTFVDLFSFDRNMLVGALQYFPEVKTHFQKLSIKIVFRSEVIAYSKAYRALEQDGLDADVWDKMDERPDYYLRKLRLIYGDDGFGMQYDGASEQLMKDQAALKVQKVYRGYRGRVLSKVKSTEHNTSGVMPPSVRSMDPTMYTARALDVFHHRAGQSLHTLHLKLDALLNGTEPRKDLERDPKDRSHGEVFSTPLDGSGKKVVGTSSICWTSSTRSKSRAAAAASRLLWAAARKLSSWPCSCSLSPIRSDPSLARSRRCLMHSVRSRNGRRGPSWAIWSRHRREWRSRWPRRWAARRARLPGYPPGVSRTWRNRICRRREATGGSTEVQPEVPRALGPGRCREGHSGEALRPRGLRRVGNENPRQN